MRVLIVDDENDLVEILEFLVQTTFDASIEIFKANSGNEAIKVIETNSIDLCICDHNMPSGMGSDVLKFIIDNKLGIKFVLCSTVLPSEKPQQYPAEHVFTNIQKPDISLGLTRVKDLLEKETTIEEIRTPSYVPVSIHLLNLMGKTPADIFVKVNETHYVKVLMSNEDFTEEDKKKYTAKSLEILFMKKGATQSTLDKQINVALQKIMEQKSIDLTDKLSITHSQLSEMIRFTGITTELAEISKKNILQSASYISKAQLCSDFWKDMMLIGEYPSKLYTLHSMLSSLIVRKMVWNSEATQFKLSLACFLQDVTLDSIALMELCDYQEFKASEERFTKSEIKKYLDHPQRSVDLLNHFKDIPADVDRILLEQHEMPNGDGFPKHLSATQLGPLSCVFILTGILARRVIKEGSTFDLQSFVSEMELKGYSKGNFKDAFEHLRNLKT